MATPVVALAKRLERRLKSYAPGAVAVVIESRRETLPIDRHYDDLLIELARTNLDAVKNERGVHVCCVTFVVSRPDLMVMRTTTSLGFLADRLRSADTAVFVLEQNEEQGDQQVWSLRLHTESLRHAIGASVPALALPPAPPVRRVHDHARELLALARSLLDYEFDHFVVPTPRSGPQLHVPCLVSCEPLAKSPEGVAAVEAAVSAFAESSDWIGVPIEFADAGISENLLLQMLGGNADRVDVGGPLEGRRVVLLTDVAYAPTRFRGVAGRLRARGAEWVGVFALVGTLDVAATDLDVATLIDLPITSSEDETKCGLCDLGVRIKPGSGIREVRRSLGTYDPGVFWQLVALLPSFVAVGHWDSPRTPNHFWLRVLMEDVLRSFGRSMAFRIAHVLEREAGVFLRWVDAIVIAHDPESGALAAALQSIVRARRPEIISVDRSILREVSPRELSTRAEAWVEDVRERLGPKANVVIVDQAAHHLRTYTALKALCDRAGWHTLAFCVVLDRTGIDSELREQLHDSHYVALYSWPFPPRLASVCTCSAGRPS